MPPGPSRRGARASDVEVARRIRARRIADDRCPPLRRIARAVRHQDGAVGETSEVERVVVVLEQRKPAVDGYFVREAVDSGALGRAGACCAEVAASDADTRYPRGPLRPLRPLRAGRSFWPGQTARARWPGWPRHPLQAPFALGALGPGGACVPFWPLRPGGARVALGSGRPLHPLDVPVEGGFVRPAGLRRVDHAQHSRHGDAQRAVADSGVDHAACRGPRMGKDVRRSAQEGGGERRRQRRFLRNSHGAVPFRFRSVLALWWPPTPVYLAREAFRYSLTAPPPHRRGSEPASGAGPAAGCTGCRRRHGARLAGARGGRRAYRSTAPSALRAARWASVTPVTPVMSIPS